MREEPYDCKELKLAWDIHKDADQTFHSRVSAYLVSQAFLVGAFAVVLPLANNNVCSKLPLLAFLAAVAVLGLVVSLVLGSRMKGTLRRLRYLKRRYLLNDPVYFRYLKASRKQMDEAKLDGMVTLEARQKSFDEDHKGWLENTFTDIIPGSVQLFWLASLGIIGWFFLTPAGATS